VRPGSPRAHRRDRERLTDRIRQAHRRSRQAGGAPRVHRQLAAQGVPCCEDSVAKLIPRAAIRSQARRRFVVRTTDGRHDPPVAANTPDRRVPADRPDGVRAADLTDAPTGQDRLDPAVVLGLCTRRVVGWATADHLRAELAGQALRMARTHWRPAEGVLRHFRLDSRSARWGGPLSLVVRLEPWAAAADDRLVWPRRSRAGLLVTIREIASHCLSS
jgi:transposase InsO family protein